MRTLSNLLIIFGIFLFLFSIWPYARDEILYRWYSFRGIHFSLEGKAPKSRFAYLISQPSPLRIDPASKDFGIVIEKINVNAPIVKNVSVTDPKAYQLALRDGVAHAKGTVLPGENGNFYLFAHSSLDYWALGKYATVFNMLRKLEAGPPVGEAGDKIVIFYKGERFDYQVLDKKVVPGWDISPLTEKYDTPMMTLQTCYPPGTTLNRLIITAELVK